MTCGSLNTRSCVLSPSPAGCARPLPSCLSLGCWMKLPSPGGGWGGFDSRHGCLTVLEAERGGPVPAWHSSGESPLSGHWSHWVSGAVEQ